MAPFCNMPADEGRGKKFKQLGVFVKFSQVVYSVECVKCSCLECHVKEFWLYSIQRIESLEGIFRRIIRELVL